MPTEEFESLKTIPIRNPSQAWGGTQLFLDGNAYCVVGLEFVDLQESDCYAFGDTREQAIATYAARKRDSA